MWHTARTLWKMPHSRNPRVPRGTLATIWFFPSFSFRQGMPEVYLILFKPARRSCYTNRLIFEVLTDVFFWCFYQMPCSFDIWKDLPRNHKWNFSIWVIWLISAINAALENWQDVMLIPLCQLALEFNRQVSKYLSCVREKEQRSASCSFLVY